MAARIGQRENSRPDMLVRVSSVRHAVLIKPAVRALVGSQGGETKAQRTLVVGARLTAPGGRTVSMT